MKWYEFKPGQWPLTGNVSLIQEGRIDLGPGVFSFFPALARNANGDVAVVMARSSASEFPSVWYARRQPGDAPGTMQPALQLSAGESGYNNYRWGDYFDIAVDPTDDVSFWGVGQFARSGNTWITYLGILGFTQGSVSYIEPGCPGSGGLIPLLETGPPAIGFEQVINVSNALGGVVFYLVVGDSESSFRLRGCELYVDFPWLMVGPLVMEGPPTPGQGHATLTFKVRNDPNLIGLSHLVQALLLDPGAPQGLATTRAARATYGDLER